MKKINLINNNDQIDINKLKGPFSSLLSLNDLLNKNILACPSTLKKIKKIDINAVRNLKIKKKIKNLINKQYKIKKVEGGGGGGYGMWKSVREININNIKIFLTDFKNIYPIIGRNILAYPLENKVQKKLTLKKNNNTLKQYLFLSQVKNSGQINDVNAPLKSTAVKKHHFRFKNFFKQVKGIVLDIGCDKPSISHKLFSKECQYIGVDSNYIDKEFCLIAMAEMLPIADRSIDNVCFNTSLDHILDYHTAIEEAARVLKANGKILISTYVWLNNATLLNDAVHFHHFRDYEIINSLSRDFSIEKIQRFKDPKSQNHRYGLYLLASKK